MKKNAIYHQECIEGMRGLIADGEQVDMIITSPPYNHGHPYIGYDDKKSSMEYIQWFQTLITTMNGVLKPEGSLFLNINPPPKQAHILQYLLNTMTEQMHMQNVIHWIKAVELEQKTLGSIRNMTSQRYLNDEHEYIFHLVKKPQKLDKQRRQVRSNVWFMQRASPNKYRRLPPKFPIELPRRCIQLYGRNPPMVVLDPCMGLGTTAMACTLEGVEYIGFEINKLTKELAEERVQNMRDNK